MRYSMLALDIDGTLTNSKKEISSETDRAVRLLRDRQVTIAVASGRPTPGCSHIVASLGLPEHGGFLLSYNGARVTDCRTGEVIFERTLEPSVIPELYDYALSRRLGMMTYDDSVILTGTPIDRYMEIEAGINGLPIHSVPDFISAVPLNVNKCLMTGDPEYLTLCEKELQTIYKDNLSVYRSEPYFLEIMPKGIDKAKSLAVLLSRLGMKREALVACGDGFNDISMLRFAGLGVAMHNAQPTVKAAADYITESNDADGIARVISSFFIRAPRKARSAA